MKLAALLVILSLATVLNTAYANEMASGDDEVVAYCIEQAERDGIENIDEKNQYVKDCADSFATPSGDSQSSGE